MRLTVLPALGECAGGGLGDILDDQFPRVIVLLDLDLGGLHHLRGSFGNLLDWWGDSS